MRFGESEKTRGYLVQDIQMSATDWLVDCVIAAGAFGFGLIQMTLSANIFIPDAFTRMLLGIRAITPTPVEMASLLLLCIPLIARRKLPWPVFALCLVLWIVFDRFVAPVDLSIISVLVALFTLACERGRAESFIAGGATLIAVTLLQALSPSSTLQTMLLFQNVALIVAVTFAGYAFHARQEYAKAAEARAVEAERTRESEASRRVEEERVRIAREVHDITAHSLSAVSIQAAAAERLMDSDPEAAKASISQVRETAKSSLEDMRAMIGVLRGGAATDTSAETAPVEGTERMGDLVDYLEEAGVRCDLLASGYNRAIVPSHIDIALFGIAREAATNIVRHASADESRIMLDTEGGLAILMIEDDGAGFDPSAPAKGHGIEGMRERASLLGGGFSITPGAFGSSRGTSIYVEIPLRSPNA